MKTSNLLEFAKGNKLQRRFIIAAMDYNNGDPICRGTLMHPDVDHNIICFEAWTCTNDEMKIFEQMDLSEIIEAERTRLLKMEAKKH